MNSYTKITLILLLSSLTTLIHAAEGPTKEMVQHHEKYAERAGKVAEFSISSLFTNGFFEMLYKKLDEKNHVPESWKFARRINRPMIGVAGLVLVGASSTWFYHASSEQFYKAELLKAEELLKAAELLKKEEQKKKWF